MTVETLRDRLRLYLVAGAQDTPGGLLETVEAALTGGVTAVQLREKSGNDLEILTMAERLKELCDDHGAAFFLNDRLDLALAVGAYGLHLGVDDLPMPVARRIAGPDLAIGFSPETDSGARSASLEGASYLGIGPIYGTASKDDAGPPIGLGILRRRAAISGLPVIGIGGITAQNAGQVISAGAVGVAVMSAILKAQDPRGAAEALREAVDGAR
ncbi:MAG: thiamine phosphate synthase [Thermomicrobiales bacterium]|nr:thiamine phosphate synthase [Thermomicrobiales bacterium]